MVVLSRKERDRQLRRSDILKAAEHIFALKGYHKATIRAIAKEAQYATGTVYLHFKDKEVLYFVLLEEKMQRLLSVVKEKTGHAENPRRKLEIYLWEGLNFFQENQDFFRIFMSDENQLSVEKRFLKSPTMMQLHEYVIGILKEAQAGGVISADLDLRQIGEVFAAILKTIVLKLLQEKNDKGANLVDLSSLILRLFLNGTARQ